MTHYLDIRVLADPETPQHQLLSALYAKLHDALVKLGANDLAVSFPGYSEAPKTLGHVLRLLGLEARLMQLMALPWLGGMRDHVVAAPIAHVPADASFRTLRRVQAKSNPERLRRRHVKRHGITTEEARVRVPDSAAEVLHLPFLDMNSASTRQRFRLFLRLGPLQAPGSDGLFNTFGLSANAATPWF